MKKKGKHKLTIFFFVATAIIIGAFLFVNFSEESSLSSFEDDFVSATSYLKNIGFELDFSNFLLECQGRTLMEGFIDNRWKVLAVGINDPFRPLIPASIVERHTANEIEDIRWNLQTKCDWSTANKIQKLEVDGTYTALILTRDKQTAQEKDIGFVSGSSIKKTTLEDNKWKTLATFSAPIGKIEDNVDWGNSNIGWIGAFTSPRLDFTITFINGDTQLSKSRNLGDAQVFELLQRQEDVPSEPTPIVSNQPMFISAIKRNIDKVDLTNGQNKLDTSSFKNRQIEITGIMRDYQVSEGFPYVIITRTDSTQVKLIMGFERYSGDDGMFRTTYIVPKDSKNGDYTVQFKHDNRPAMGSTKFFTVQNSGTEDTGNDDPTKISLESFKANTVVHYKHVFQNFVPRGFDTGTTVETFDECDVVEGVLVNILPSSIVRNEVNDGSCGSSGNLETGTFELEEIILTPQVKMPNAETLFNFKNLKSSDLTQTTKITFNGKTTTLFEKQKIPELSPQPNILCAQVSGKIVCPSLNVPLGEFAIRESEIVKKAVDSDTTFQAEADKQYPIKIKSEISGNFILEDKKGNEYTGVVSKTIYEWTPVYQDLNLSGHSGVGGCNSSDPELCCEPDTEELVVNEEGQLECKAVDLVDNDKDGDGIIDVNDACPDEAGVESRAGCPEDTEPEDTDGDGVPDVNDACPDEIGSKGRNGCPLDTEPEDKDGDGIIDVNDACPDEVGVEPTGCPLIDKCPQEDEIYDEQKMMCIDKPDGGTGVNGGGEDPPKGNDGGGDTIICPEGSIFACADENGNGIPDGLEGLNAGTTLMIIGALTVVGGVSALILKRRNRF